MAKIHVLLKKEELDGQRLPGRVVIVLDVLFATSSMVTALAHGASEVLPTRDGAAALKEAPGRPPGSYLLSGEPTAETREYFPHPTPLALLHHPLSPHYLTYSTTHAHLPTN